MSAKLEKGNSVVVLFFVVLVILLVGFFFYGTGLKKIDNTFTTSIPIVSPTPEPSYEVLSEETIHHTDWEDFTYGNSSLSFQYPSAFSFAVGGEGCGPVFWANKTMWLTICGIIEGTAEQIAKARTPKVYSPATGSMILQPERILEQKHITVNGKTGIWQVVEEDGLVVIGIYLEGIQTTHNFNGTDKVYAGVSEMYIYLRKPDAKETYKEDFKQFLPVIQTFSYNTPLSLE